MKLALQSDKRKNPALIEYRAMTREEVLALRYGDHPEVLLNNGRVGVAKVNGAVRTWKRNPSRIEVPVKYGMYEFATLDLEQALARFVVREQQ